MTLAEEFFDIYPKYWALRDRLELAIARIVEDFEEEKITFDYYDSSFELKECESDLFLTNEQIIKLRDLGFWRCWLCYKDGSEKHYHLKEKE